MSAESNRVLGATFFKEQDRLRGGPAPELCAAGYTAHIAGNPPFGRDGHEQFALMFYAAFPDVTHTIETTVADEEQVAVRFTLRGTHNGPFMGVPATGKRIDVSAIAILRIREGKVAALEAVFDQMGLMRQLGVLPSPV